MKISLFVRVFALIIFIGLGGCTRLAQESSKFTISLPAQKKMASKSATAQAVTGILGHVVINVRGAGIQVPISLNFDAQESADGTITPVPPSVTIEVPSGSARLIQVLAIYMDTATENGEFYYGDTTTDLAGGEVSIGVPIALTGTGNVKGGRIAGRYFSADGSNPTGILESRYQPPGGKPPMVIERSSMIRGWFGAFALESVPLDIVLAPSEEMIAQGFAMNSLTFSNDQKMKIKVPDRYQSFGGGGGENKHADAAVIGFFGPGVPANHRVCYTQANYTFTSLFTNSSSTTPVVWSASSTNAADVTAQKDASVGVCSGLDLAASYLTVIPFNPSLLSNWGGSEALSGFLGVFKFPTNTTNGSAPVAVSFNAGQFTAQFSLLPGVPVVADTMGIFYRPLNSPRDYDRSSEAPCQSIAQGGFGFRPAGTIPLVVGTQDYSVTRPAPADISTNSVFAFCPMRGNLVLGGGFVNGHIWNSAGGGGGGGGTPMPANSFTFHTQATMGTNQCHRAFVSLVNVTGGNTSWNVTNDTARNFTIFSTSGHTFYTSEAACAASTGPITSFSIAANSANSEFWVRSGGSPASESMTVASSSSFSSPLSRSYYINVQVPGAVTVVKSPMEKITMPMNSCQTIELNAFDVNGVPSSFGSPTSMTLNKFDFSNPISDSSFGYFSDCASTSSISTVTFPAGALRTTFAVKTTSSPTADRIIRVTGGYGTSDTYLNVTPLADHLAVNINNGQPFYVGDCVSVNVRAEDGSNALVSSATFQFNLYDYHPTNGANFGEFRYNCSSPMSGPYTLATGNFALTYLAQTAQNGVFMDANSLFIARQQQTSFNILDVPAFARGPTLKVHLTSDVATPSVTDLTIWRVPSFAGLSFMPVTESTSASTGSNPKSEGVRLMT